jgi:diadenylate cyclase
MDLIQRIPWPGFSGLLEILILAVVFYYILLFFHGTRGAQVLSGLVVLFLALMVVTYFFRLDTLNWLLQRFTVYLAIGLLIIFQPEIRRALAELGKQHMFAPTALERSVVDTIVKAVTMLAEQKIGALIAVERAGGTRPIQESGVAMDSLVTPELLASIFYPHTPLHDGGVIIRSDRIAAAGCMFPLSQREGLSKSLGTRHRAALGLSEEADAIVVIVSEETGTVSVAFRGRLRRGVDEERLARILNAVLVRRSGAKNSASRRRRFWEGLRAISLRPRPAASSTQPGEEVEEHAR